MSLPLSRAPVNGRSAGTRGPICFKCACNRTFRLRDVSTPVAIYGCDECGNLFSPGERQPAPATARRRRIAILTRWMTLVDEASRLAEDVRAEPHDGAFTPEEQTALSLALDQMWRELEWSRPQFPLPITKGGVK